MPIGRLLGGEVFSTTSALGGIVQIATGRRHTCALISTGSVRCWGENFFGQIGVGTTTDVLRPAVVPSFTLNIDPLVSVKGRGRVATVDILAICDGQHLHADVILMQGSVTGHGVAVGQCTGALERYPVTVAAQGPVGFSKGPAVVDAEALVRERGEIIDAQAWRRAVNVVAP